MLRFQGSVQRKWTCSPAAGAGKKQVMRVLAWADAVPGALPSTPLARGWWVSDGKLEAMQRNPISLCTLAPGQ